MVVGFGWRVPVGAVAGATAAIVWAVSLAIYQPVMQPRGLWTHPGTGETYPVIADNNTYWPRDIRQLAILLAFAGLVLIGDASVRGIVAGLVATVGWLGVDLWLDRIDIAGRTAAWWLAGAALIGFAAASVVIARVSAGRPGAAAGRHVTAATAAALATVTLVVTTPWEEPVTRPDWVRVELALSLLKAALVVMFAAVALGLVTNGLSASALDAARARWVATFALLTALTAWPATTMSGSPGVVALVLPARPDHARRHRGPRCRSRPPRPRRDLLRGHGPRRHRAGGHRRAGRRPGDDPAGRQSAGQRRRLGRVARGDRPGARARRGHGQPPVDPVPRVSLRRRTGPYGLVGAGRRLPTTDIWSPARVPGPATRTLGGWVSTCWWSTTTPTVSDVVRRYLERAGLRGDPGRRRPGGARRGAGRRPDLVVLDLMLPGIDGLEVCRRLRADDPTLPVIMLTALGEEADRVARPRSSAPTTT